MECILNVLQGLIMTSYNTEHQDLTTVAIVLD
jgi:hypothetical protein